MRQNLLHRSSSHEIYICQQRLTMNTNSGMIQILTNNDITNTSIWLVPVAQWINYWLSN